MEVVLLILEVVEVELLMMEEMLEVGVTWLMRERPPMPGGGESGGEPNPLPVKRPEAENRDIALKRKKIKLWGAVTDWDNKVWAV